MRVKIINPASVWYGKTFEAKRYKNDLECISVKIGWAWLSFKKSEVEEIPTP